MGYDCNRNEWRTGHEGEGMGGLGPHAGAGGVELSAGKGVGVARPNTVLDGGFRTVSWRYQVMGEVARWLPKTGRARRDLAVVFTQGHLGDILHTAPMLRRLREARPAWKIIWLVGPWEFPLAERFSAFADEIVVFASDSFCHHRGVQEHRQSAWAQWRLGLSLRAMRPRAFIATSNESPVARYLANIVSVDVWSGIGDRRPPRVNKDIQTCFVPYEKERYEADALM